MVELKSGESYSGHLVNCDQFMNLVLREVTYTTKVWVFSIPISSFSRLASRMAIASSS